MTTQTQINTAVATFVKGDAKFGAFLLGYIKGFGKIGEAAWKASHADAFALAFEKAAPGDAGNPVKLSWVKANVIGRSHGIAGPEGVQAYYKATKDAQVAAGLRKASKAGAKAGAKSKAATPADPKSETPADRQRMAHKLLGRADMAACLLIACESGNREQFFKYLAATFPVTAK